MSTLVSIKLLRGLSHRHSRKSIVITAQAKKSAQKPKGGTGFAKNTKKPTTESPTPAQEVVVAQQTTAAVETSTTISNNAPIVQSNTTSTADTPTSTSLPTIPRDQILGTCVSTSALIAGLALGLHLLTPTLQTVLPSIAHGDDIDTLTNWLTVPSIEDAGIAAAVAGGVTAARLALLMIWSDFREASERSNNQVLAPLTGPVDVLTVSLLPGVAEELLFRGSLIPLISADYKGIGIAGLVFGALHVNGGRNAAFAVWASVVGVVYGATFVYTGNIWAPILAHSVANIASASLYKSSSSKA